MVTKRLGSLLAFCLALAAQPPPSPASGRAVSLGEAAARIEPDFRPKLLGETVTVRGVVQIPPVAAADAVYLAIVDETAAHRALTLVYSGDNIGQLPPNGQLRSGQVVEVEGIVSLYAGQAVVKPTLLRIVGEQSPPAPAKLSPKEAASLAMLGRLVEVEGVVSEYRESTTGDTLQFQEAADGIKLYLPLPKPGMERALRAYRSGDRIKARGLVTQFCLSPPYNRYFQLLLAHPMDVETIAPAPSPSPRWLPVMVLLVLGAILAGWHAQQRHHKHNRLVQRLLNTAETLMAAASAREVADTLRSGLREFLPADAVHLFRYDAERRYLEKVPDSESNTTHALHIDEATNVEDRSISLAIRNRGVISFADSRRAPLLNGSTGEHRAILAIPIRHRDAVHGAILLTAKPGRRLVHESLHPALLHLAADAGEHLDRLEQTALREQLHRSEKLSVAGQLIHGVLTELRAPLESIRHTSRNLADPEGAVIRREVEKASDTVNRIVSVARAEQMDSRPVGLPALLEKLESLIRNLPAAVGIQFSFNAATEPIQVLGSQLQLQRVFENLLQHAMAAAGHSLEKRLSVNLNRIGRSAMIEIEFSGPFGDGEGPDFSASALGLAICRGLVQSHGGDVRFVTIRPGQFRYETELPSLSASADDGPPGYAPGGAQGQLTVLLVEPELQAQRRVLSIFGELDHRLVPVSSIQEATDLAEKMRFDLVIASARPEGGTWAELFHRVHHRTPHFALMTESAAMQESEAGANLIDGRSASLIAKPVEESDIARLLAQIESRTA